jgi:hypothetical protein
MANEPDVSPQELSQRFAQLVMMQVQNILYLLGRLPGPHGEAPPPQLPEAKMLIDQLEMLHAKTKGNVTPQEAKLLDNAMTQTRLAFVEASGGTPPSMMPSHPAYGFPGEDAFEEDLGPEPEPEPAPTPKAASPVPSPAPAQPEAEPAPVEEKKKFFKSYG